MITLISVYNKILKYFRVNTKLHTSKKCQKYKYGVPQMKYDALCLLLVKKSPTRKLRIKLGDRKLKANYVILFN